MPQETKWNDGKFRQPLKGPMVNYTGSVDIYTRTLEP